MNLFICEARIRRLESICKLDIEKAMIMRRVSFLFNYEEVRFWGKMDRLDFLVHVYHFFVVLVNGSLTDFFYASSPT